MSSSSPPGPTIVDVLIVGAGISGLTAAWKLQQLQEKAEKSNLNVVILEGTQSELPVRPT
jgi:cation diffusion facilitator CzcD-associated flavoprotein CzcO